MAVVEARGRSLSFTLPAGARLVDAVRDGFAAAGFASGVLELGGVALAPFGYVMPALSDTPKHAAFYSRVFAPEGISRLKDGAMTFGTRDGAPFFHCHALWTEADGRCTGGHILPEQTFLAEDATVTAYGIDGTSFEATVCRETNFKLFEPRPAAPAFASGTPGLGRCFAIRMRPNQDFCGALEAFCRDRTIASATIRGGVGSTIEARFADGSETINFATEVYVRSGRVAPGVDGRLAATLDVSLVDFTGATAEGRLTRGDNPILMTFELVLVED